MPVSILMASDFKFAVIEKSKYFETRLGETNEPIKNDKYLLEKR